MKCNKCGTPIILGESRCRFCGSVIEKKEEPKKVEIIEEQKKPEIIEVPIQKKEVIEIPKPKVEIIEAPVKKEIIEIPKPKEIIRTEIIEIPKKKEEIIDILPKKEEMIKKPVQKMEIIEEKIEKPKRIEIIEEKPKKEEIIDIREEIKEEPKKEIDINEELEKTAKLERVNLEEFTGQITKSEIEEINNQIEVNEEIKEEIEEEKKNVVTQVVEKAFHDKANSFLLVGVLAVVLAISLTMNGFLYINRYSLEGKKSEEISEDTRTVYFDNYELNIPENWKTKGITANNNMLIFDNSNEWGATIEILKNSVFEQTEQYKDEINDSLSKKGYALTSSYNKETDDMDFYIYKGKYNSYSVYVLVGKINDENAIVTDLKFKGEVNKEILNNIIDIVSNINSNDLNSLYESDFEFKQIGDSVKENIKISEDVIQ